MHECAQKLTQVIETIHSTSENITLKDACDSRGELTGRRIQFARATWGIDEAGDFSRDIHTSQWPVVR
jgi:hypothetical protein